MDQEVKINYEAEKQESSPRKRGRPPADDKKRIIKPLTEPEEDGEETDLELTEQIDAKGEEKIDIDGNLLGGTFD
jgi:hypothetical protein